MGKHLHKQFSEKEVKEVLERYLSKEIGVEHGLAMLKIKRRRFFDLLKVYRERPDEFSLKYKRKGPNRQIDPKIEKLILKELGREKKIIEDKDNPVRDYNYSYIRNVLGEKHGVEVSLSTIIGRAKKMGFTRRKNTGNPMIGRF